MRYCSAFVLNLAFLLAVRTVAAQQVGDFFHHLTAEQGLSQANNAFMYHDSRGFMWVSSIDGLNRFDGYRCRVYRPQRGQPRSLLGPNVTSGFFEDAASGDLWFCTNEALHCYRRRTDDFDHWQLPKPQGRDTFREDYYAFHLETSGKLWLRLGDQDQSHLFVFDTKTGRSEPLGPVYGNRCQVLTDTEQRIVKIFSFVYGDSTGLFQTALTPSGAMRERVFFNDARHRFTDIFIENENCIWLASNVGLIRLQPQDGQTDTYPCPANSGSVAVCAVRPLNARELAVSTVGAGLLLFDRKAFGPAFQKDPGRNTSISDNSLNDIYLDRSRNLWVSQWGYGLNFTQIGKKKIDNIHLSRLDPHVGDIGSLAESADGRVWCSTKGKVFIFENQRLIKIFGQKEGLPNTYLSGLYADKKGRMWVASIGRGLFWYDEKSGRFRLVKGSDTMPHYGAPCLRELNDGRLFMSDSVFVEVVPSANGTSFQVLPATLPGKIDPSKVVYFYQDKKGNFYLNYNIATTLLLRPDGAYLDLRLNDLKACYEDPDGQHIWLATTSGLAKVPIGQPEQMQLYDERNILPNQYLYSVLPDGEGHLWLSSNQGILRFDMRSDTARQYTAADGVWENEFYTNAWLLTRSGDIWMGNRNVLNVFRPAAMRDVEALPSIQITHLKVNDLDWKGTAYIGEADSLDFAYTDNTLSFDFAALEYSDPAKNRLKYTLEGYDRQWIELPPGVRGFARYAKLPPGHYTLKIMAANSDGLWNPVPRELSIHIQAPYWQTWWFWTLVVSALAAAGYAGYRYRLRQVRREYGLRQIALEHELAARENALRAAEFEMSALRAQMNPHFIFNSLNSINAFILSNRGAEASTYLERFARLMRQILDHSSSPTIRLEEEVEFLNNYLALEAVRMSGRLTHHIRLADDVDDFGTELPPMILQPFVENAIWHGIAHRTESGGEVVIDFKKEGRTLVCTVQDNGKGLQAKAQQLGNGQHKSKALKIVTERLALYDQRHSTQSSVTLHDRSQSGEGSGTLVTVRIGQP